MTARGRAQWSDLSDKEKEAYGGNKKAFKAAKKELVKAGGDATSARAIAQSYQNQNTGGGGASAAQVRNYDFGSTVGNKDVKKMQAQGFSNAQIKSVAERAGAGNVKASVQRNFGIHGAATKPASLDDYDVDSMGRTNQQKDGSERADLNKAELKFLMQDNNFSAGDINDWAKKNNYTFGTNAQTFLNERLNAMTQQSATDVTDPGDGSPVINTKPSATAQSAPTGNINTTVTDNSQTTDNSQRGGNVINMGDSDRTDTGSSVQSDGSKFVYKGTGDFTVGGDLNQNVGKVMGDQTNTFSNTGTFIGNNNQGADYSTTFGFNTAGNVNNSNESVASMMNAQQRSNVEFDASNPGLTVGPNPNPTPTLTPGDPAPLPDTPQQSRPKVGDAINDMRDAGGLTRSAFNKLRSIVGLEPATDEEFAAELRKQNKLSKFVEYKAAGGELGMDEWEETQIRAANPNMGRPTSFNMNMSAIAGRGYGEIDPFAPTEEQLNRGQSSQPNLSITGGQNTQVPTINPITPTEADRRPGSGTRTGQRGLRDTDLPMVEPQVGRPGAERDAILRITPAVQPPGTTPIKSNQPNTNTNRVAPPRVRETPQNTRVIGTGNVAVGGDLNANVGKTMGNQTNVFDNSGTFIGNNNQGADYSVTIGYNNAGNQAGGSGSGAGTGSYNPMMDNMFSGAALGALNDNAFAKSQSQFSGSTRAAQASARAAETIGGRESANRLRYSAAMTPQYFQELMRNQQNRYLGDTYAFTPPTYVMPEPYKPPTNNIEEIAKRYS